MKSVKLKENVIFKLIVIFFLAISSCYNPEQKKNIAVQPDITHKEQSNNKYELIPLKCDINRLPNICSSSKNQLSIEFWNQLENSFFRIKKSDKTFNHNLDSFFEGLGYKISLYQKDKNFIIMINLEYEYTNKILLFDLNTNDRVEYLGSFTIEIHENSPSTEETELFYYKDSLKFKFDKEIKIIKKNGDVGLNTIVKNEDIQSKDILKWNWEGTYVFELLDIERMGESHSISYRFFIGENSFIETTINESSTKKFYCNKVKVTKDTLIIRKEKSNKDYVLLKSRDQFFISGDEIYMLNPPNDKYTLKKLNK